MLASDLDNFDWRFRHSANPKLVPHSPPAPVVLFQEHRQLEASRITILR